MIRALGFLFIAMRAFGLDQSLVHSVAVFDKPKRMTIENYGASKKELGIEGALKRYAATGVLLCGNRQASAQVTGARDIITTSDHLFFDRENCQAKANAEECVLTLKTIKGYRKYPVFKKIAGGFKCPGQNMRWGDDWAILQLKDAVKEKDVEPYKIPMVDDVHKEDEPVVAVAGSSRDFFEIAANGAKFHPRNIQDCTVKFIRDVSGGGSYVETDCDNAELASGGSLLRPGGDGDTLIGIMMGSFELKPMLEQALKEGRTNTAPYVQGSWSAIYTSVDGEFLKALTQAVGRDI